MMKDEELEQIFREEATEFIESLSEKIRQLRSLSGQPFHDAFDTVCRITHNLKGAACSTGANAVESLSHGLEGILALEKNSDGPLPRHIEECALDTLGVIQAAVDSMVSEKKIQETIDILTELGEKLSEKNTSSFINTKSQTDSQRPSQTSASPFVIKVDPHKLDKLIKFVGEFLTFRSRLINTQSQQNDIYRQLQLLQKSNTNNHSELIPVMSDIRRLLLNGRKDILDFTNLVEEVSETAKHLRTVPLRGAAHLWRRIVRESCQICGKEADLEVSVGQVEIDRYVLERIQDPMMHLLRNAIDHGLESPDERLAAGKSARGLISVTASLQGSMIRLEITDDGKGINCEKVKKKAIKSGLIGEDAAVGLSNSQIADMLFTAGFSTVDQINKISGRGVGLDVVRSQIEALGGRAEIELQPQAEGTTIVLWVPVNILSSTGLFVRCGKSVYVLPIESIVRTLRVHKEAVKTVDGKNVVIIEGGDPVKVISLAEVMGNPKHNYTDKINIVVLGRGRRYLGLTVDEVSGHREYVSHALPWNLQNLPGVSGAIMEADGSVAILVDIVHLFEKTQTQLMPDHSAVSSHGKRVLVVDDSMSSRAMQRAMLRADGFEVVLASDGQEAWRILQDDPFDLVVSDIQMPNMDGLELTRKIRASHKLKDLTVILASNLSSPQDKAAGADAGADDYLVKGAFDQHRLLNIVHKYLGH